jgi:hypothetical protein
MTAFGTKLPIWNVRFSDAIGWLESRHRADIVKVTRLTRSGICVSGLLPRK